VPEAGAVWGRCPAGRKKTERPKKGTEIFVEVPSVSDRIEVRPYKSHLLTGEKDK
jgi:hypothetical protein